MCLLFLCIVRQENIYVRMNTVKENINMYNTMYAIDTLFDTI